jgi:hypothetical protein
MTIEARRKALQRFIETADENTINAMYLQFACKHSKPHNIYKLYSGQLPQLLFPALETPSNIPDIVKPFTAKSGAKKAGRTKK